MSNKRIFLSSPTMNGHEMDYINEAFDTNWIAPLGANVNGLEEDIVKYTGTGYAAALSAGTAAIHLALKLANVQQNDIVFCPTLTFSATCNPILYEKATPVFIDSEKDTWNMDPVALKKAFEKYPNPKAVLLVHLYGTPAKLDEIIAICEEHNVPLIEDAAESLGATYHNRQTGTFGKYGIYSFNGNKIITTSGGGMLVSDCEEDIIKARFWATQSRETARHYEHKEIGYNYRMSNIVAGIGRGQMHSLDHHIEKKKWIYNYYKEAFKQYPVISMNPYMPDTVPNYWLSCITLAEECIASPNDIMDALDAMNMEARPIWKPMHMQPVFKEYDFISTCLQGSIAEKIFDRGICLPSDIKNTEADMKKIVNIIESVLKR